jgi:prophage tail gpP-like protein
MPDRDEVSVTIDGTEFKGWTGVTISMAVDQIADGIALTAPFDPDRADLRAILRPLGYQHLEVRIGGDLVFTGRAELIETPLTDSGRVLSVQGRSLPGVLSECAIDGDLEFSGLTLAAIARKVCAPFGIKIRADADSPAIEVARAEYGQSAAAFLDSLASPRLLLINSSYKGELIISSAQALRSKPAAVDLEEGRDSLTAISASYDGTKRHSVYKVSGQFAGIPDVGGSTTDPTVPVYRPRLAASSDIDADPAVTARRLRSESECSSVSISVDLPGWRRPDGALWAERQALSLKAPSVMLRAKSRYVIAGCTLRLADSGASTSLRLVFPESYSGGTPEVMPWL